MRKSFRCAVGCVILGMLGCGDSSPRLVPVRGIVTVDGKALVHKTVQFIPEPGTPGQGAGANTNSNGEYSLIAMRPGAVTDMPGVPAGKYRVIVTEPMFPIVDDSLEAQDSSGAPTVAIGPPKLSSSNKPKGPPIPASYTKKETTPLKIDVPADGGTIDLRLNSK